MKNNLKVFMLMIGINMNVMIFKIWYILDDEKE